MSNDLEEAKPKPTTDEPLDVWGADKIAAEYTEDPDFDTKRLFEAVQDAGQTITEFAEKKRDRLFDKAEHATKILRRLKEELDERAKTIRAEDEAAQKAVKEAARLVAAIFEED